MKKIHTPMKRRWWVCITALLMSGAVLPAAAETAAETVAEIPAETLPLIETPEVSWFARLLGQIGLPTLVVIAGTLAGVLTAVIVMAFVRARDRHRCTAPVDATEALENFEIQNESS